MPSTSGREPIPPLSESFPSRRMFPFDGDTSILNSIQSIINELTSSEIPLSLPISHVPRPKPSETSSRLINPSPPATLPPSPTATPATPGPTLSAIASPTTLIITQTKTTTFSPLTTPSSTESSPGAPITTTTTLSEATPSTAPDHPLSFFQRKGLVAGVFGAIGCIIIILVLFIVLLLRRSRRTKILQPDGTLEGVDDTGTNNSHARGESWSAMRGASLTSYSSFRSQNTTSLILDSDSRTSLIPHTSHSTNACDTLSLDLHTVRYPSPPPAYGDLSRRPTVSVVHELGTQ